MFTLEKVPYKEIEQYRVNYLNSLPEFQDIILEFIIHDSVFYKIKSEGKEIGYCITDWEFTLIEFYLFDAKIPKRNEIFKKVLSKLEIKKVYCKSFDYVLMKCCLQENMKYRMMGHLYRNLYPGIENQELNIKARFADRSDIHFLLQQEDEVFEPKNRLEEFIEEKGIVMYAKKKRIVGCGFITRVHPDFEYVDIGVWTNPEYRRQGIATHIITHLKDTCLADNKIPICGCANSNKASQKTLEKCGFSSKHKLIEYHC